VQKRIGDAIWMRIVDVQQALAQRPYGARGELTFALPADEMCPWNGTSYLLETDGRTTEVRPTDRAPQLTMRVNSLSTLLAGHRSATHLARAGLVEATDQGALALADALFRTEYAPHCPNGF
jgi:predicted acetyltransferase